MKSNKPSKRKPKKFTGSTKVTLAALSMISFIGGWNLIARLEGKETQVPQPTPTPLPPTSTLLTRPSAPLPTATPWPAIAPLPSLSPIPALTTAQQLGDQINIPAPGMEPASGPAEITPIQIVPLPTLAPLPTMAPLPAISVPPPPPPPVVVWTDGGGNHSGGS